jgi:hypothetical protein
MLHTLALVALLGTISGAALGASPARSAAFPEAVAPEAPLSPTARDARDAEAALDRLKAEYPLLSGITVTIGSTPRGEEAVAYYTRDEILIDSGHKVDVETILAHEIWHIIDWRDNGRIDWGEYVPPANQADFRNNS